MSSDGTEQGVDDREPSANDADSGIMLAIKMLAEAVSDNTKEVVSVSNAVSAVHVSIERLREHDTDIDARVSRIEDVIEDQRTDRLESMQLEIDALRVQRESEEEERLKSAKDETKLRQERRNFWIKMVATFCMGILTQPLTQYLTNLIVSGP